MSLWLVPFATQMLSMKEQPDNLKLGDREQLWKKPAGEI